ncbi:28092_t:CDS:2 [Gigaspora margarita]|uniref:28092_t:CDS:1 n=1 Tax=Gigaspora margarita TaxID=4874 RepID=A0ABN7W1U2_GIGMA|nr:28092_t:CDS:2 [Gigaspora margarita]
MPWILASLNHCYSQIDITTWNVVGETTNAAEFAYADINCEEKGLNLMNATGRDNGPIAKAAQSIK